MLISTRVLQGVGGALMVPVGRLVVLRSTAKTDLVRAIAYLTWPALLAPVIAPALGGLLSTYASWRWIFVINVPLGVAGLLLAWRLVPDVRADRVGGLDWRGFALTALGVAALVLGLEDIGAAEPNRPLVGDRAGGRPRSPSPPPCCTCCGRGGRCWTCGCCGSRPTASRRCPARSSGP